MKSNRLLFVRHLDRLAAAALLTVVLALSTLAPAVAIAKARALPTAAVVVASDVLAAPSVSPQANDDDVVVCALCKSPVCTGLDTLLNASTLDCVVPVAWSLIPPLPFAAPKPLPAGPPSRASALPSAFNPRAPPSVG